MSPKRMLVLVFAVFFVGLAASIAFARKWTDSTGKYSVEAEFVDFMDGKVQLKKENGDPVFIVIERLSLADQAYVKSQVPAQVRNGREKQQTLRKKPYGNAKPPDGKDSVQRIQDDAKKKVDARPQEPTAQSPSAGGEKDNKPPVALWWRQEAAELDTQKLVLLLLPVPDFEGELIKIEIAKSVGYKSELQGVPESLEKATRYEVDKALATDFARRQIDNRAGSNTMEARERAVQEFQATAAKLGLDAYELRQRLFVPEYERSFSTKRHPLGQLYVAPLTFDRLGIDDAHVPSLSEQVRAQTGLSKDDATALVKARLLLLWNWGVDVKSVKDAKSLNKEFLAVIEHEKAAGAKVYGLTVEEYERGRRMIINSCQEEQQKSAKTKDQPR